MTHKLGHTDLVFGVHLYNEDSLVGMFVQDYKSLFAVFAICTTMVNIQTGRYTHRQTDREH